jgi:hypothetical protein
MWLKKYILFFFILFLINDLAFSQKIPVKKDSTILYKNIETYSRRSKFTTFLYRLVFKPHASISKKKVIKRGSYKNLIQQPYSTFEGKIIRHIDIVTLDPFGYSVTDTTQPAQNFLYKAGNKAHIKSRSLTIWNLLLIRKNQPFNSLRVKESERLIRIQKYVHDVSFYVVNTGLKSDSVDIFIRELDKWSIIPDGAISGSGLRIGFTDKNFMGSGSEFINTYSRDFTKKISAFSTNYAIPNIRNSYINTIFHYGIDTKRNYNRSLAFERPFYSPLTKWAAGASFASQFRNDTLKDINLIYDPVRLKFRTQDFWAGKAVRLFKDNSEEDLITNLIFTARYLRIRYAERPPELNDPLHIYSNEDFYFFGIGISTRKYVQDKYVFQYGVTEDVPIGKVYGLTGGYQVRDNSGRYYLGMRYSFGNYFKWGYLSSDLEYGTFFKSSTVNQGVFTAGINYFTGLFEIGNWKFRQFVKPQVTIGINRFSYDSLSLNNGHGIDGFNSPALSGTTRILLTLQTQSYAPWHFLGFHFGPYLMCSLGLLGNAATGFKNNKVYSLIGLGVLIKNVNLVFSTFQISVSFYPVIPGTGQNVLRTNSFRTTDFGFSDFEFGKPAIIIYQ